MHYHETLSTLRFGCNCKLLRTTPIKIESTCITRTSELKSQLQALGREKADGRVHYDDRQLRILDTAALLELRAQMLCEEAEVAMEAITLRCQK